MERATSFEQLSDVLGLVTHTFCPIAPNISEVNQKDSESMFSESFVV